jgi:hypothetical protein
MRPARIFALGAITLLLVLVLTAPASAGGRPFATTLTGTQEAPGPGDPDGSGSASLELNHGQGTICYTLTISGLATPTAAHIHAAPTGVPGPVVVPLVPPVGGTSSACATVDRDLIKAIIQHPEDYYVNVHTTEFPAGAIRGQLSK